VGPYYAMFPVDFADKVVKKYTDPGDLVLDPFAGRGTAIFSAATQKRSAVGIELNPVGYVYGKTKLRPARQIQVHRRLEQVAEQAGAYCEEAARLPRFFHRCFSRSVRRFLLAARAELNWRRNRVDRTLMALLLVYLHGKEGASLSNQMRQAKAMSPQYAIRWWDERDLDPPELDPVDFLTPRLEWRYAKGVPAASGGRIYLGDSLELLSRLRGPVQEGVCPRARLLFTSPPYHGVTNYFYDQWLRLWLLGGPPHALRTGHALGGKFDHHENYRALLHRIFTRAATLLTRDATVYVRTDTREFTLKTTAEVLREVFPAKKLRRVHRPLRRPSQTQLFGDTVKVREKTGDVDLILSP
jgi:hypothetical protein